MGPCVSCSSTRRCASGGSSSPPAARARWACSSAHAGRRRARGRPGGSPSPTMASARARRRTARSRSRPPSALSARVASALSIGTLGGSTVLAISGHTSMVRIAAPEHARQAPTTKLGGSSLAPARMSVIVRGADREAACGLRRRRRPGSPASPSRCARSKDSWTTAPRIRSAPASAPDCRAAQ